ncbi:MAG: amphi-Trp domain-containing protein [Desulfobacula sp.]|uniref:amphi-Trp domain-containing protein n=1 Tax=Desulfobacula sp. TaxID=2593537 RepID=UPI0025C150D4|nr:amphi-Trp domain-containing protein [Desulfobacula sp.]MCD4720814.1 amphi-Trp domain-containing protein [Desulfobacula sp.]
MTKRKIKPERDLEKTYSTKHFVTKLRRLADSLEQNKRFRIQIAGERISVPPNAIFNIEHEREGNNEEVEFQMKWVVPEK